MITTTFRTLEVNTTYPENNTLYAEASLVVTGRLDFEQFDVMYLTIVVTDETTVHNDNYTTGKTCCLYPELFLIPDHLLFLSQLC